MARDEAYTSSVIKDDTFPCRAATLLSLCDISPRRGITSRGRLTEMHPQDFSIDTSRNKM